MIEGMSSEAIHTIEVIFSSVVGNFTILTARGSTATPDNNWLVAVVVDVFTDTKDCVSELESDTEPGFDKGGNQTTAICLSEDSSNIVSLDKKGKFEFDRKKCLAIQCSVYVDF